MKRPFTKSAAFRRVLFSWHESVHPGETSAPYPYSAHSYANSKVCLVLAGERLCGTEARSFVFLDGKCFMLLYVYRCMLSLTLWGRCNADKVPVRLKHICFVWGAAGWEGGYLHDPVSMVSPPVLLCSTCVQPRPGLSSDQSTPVKTTDLHPN